MKTICNSFVNRIKNTTKLGLGASTIFQLGHNCYIETALKFPDAQILIGSGKPNEPNARIIKYATTHKELFKLMENNKGLLLELVLSELVQHWFDYLLEIYKEVIKKSIRGEKCYNLPKLQPKIDVTKISSTNLEQVLIDASVESFDFETSQNKLHIIRKALNVDLSNVSNDVESIKKFITIRNIFQHNLGVVRTDDVVGLGFANISLDTGKSIRQFKVGDRLELSPFDIEAYADSIIAVSQALVSSNS